MSQRTTLEIYKVDDPSKVSTVPITYHEGDLGCLIGLSCGHYELQVQRNAAKTPIPFVNLPELGMTRTRDLYGCADVKVMSIKVLHGWRDK